MMGNFMGKGKFPACQTDDCRIKIDVHSEEKNIWRTQQITPKLFQIYAAKY